MTGSAVAGALRIDLSMGTAQFEQGTKRVEAAADRMAAKLNSSIGGLGRLFKLDMAVRFGQQLLMVEDRMEQLASQIRDTADRADIGVEALQRLRHAADQNGTSAEAMDSALVRLNKAMGLARSGAEGMDKIFAALGLDQLITKGANTEQMFYGLSNAVSMMKDESQASAIMARIMGREADRLIELMKQGAPAVQRIGAELKRAFSDDTVNKLDEARDKTEEFKKVLNSFAADASAFVVGAGAGLTAWLVTQFEWIEKNTGAMTALADTYDGLANFGKGNLAKSFGVGDQLDENAKLLDGFRRNFMSKPVAANVDVSANPNQAKLDQLFGGGDGKSGGVTAEQLTIEQAFNAVLDQRNAAGEYNNSIKAIELQQFTALNEARYLTMEQFAQLDAQLAQGVVTADQYRDAIFGVGATMDSEFERAASSVISNLDRIDKMFQHLSKASASQWLSMGDMMVDTLSTVFGESKEFAIAEAVINTAQAITKALTLPFPVNIAAAAAVGAMGAAQIAKIASTNKGGGGGGAPTVSAAASTAAAAPAQGPSQTLFVQGINRNDFFSGDMVSSLIEELLQRQRDGARVVLGGR